MSSLSHSAQCLLRQARHGNQDALGQLLQSYRGYIGLLARVQIDRRLQGRFSSSDLVQETFLYAKEGFPDFRGTSEAELLAWLRKILANRLISLFRHHTAGRRNVFSEQELGMMLDESSESFAQRLAKRHEPSVHRSLTT